MFTEPLLLEFEFQTLFVQQLLQLLFGFQLLLSLGFFLSHCTGLISESNKHLKRICRQILGLRSLLFKISLPISNCSRSTKRLLSPLRLSHAPCILFPSTLQMLQVSLLVKPSQCGSLLVYDPVLFLPISDCSLVF